MNNLGGKQAVWIFPVPANPEETKIDIIKGFPRLTGSDIKSAARQSVTTGFMLMSLSQVYTGSLLIINVFGGGYYAGLSGDNLGAVQGGVEVYEHIEKMGLTTELITTQDVNALNSYLGQRGLNLPSDSKAILDGYIGKEYSFVVSWISDVEKFKNESAINNRYGNYYYGTNLNLLGVYVSFPTDKIFFPLKPTSVYGSAQIPISVYVMGHVTPELYSGISSAQTSYLVQNSYSVPYELSQFFNGKTQIQGLKYTKIKIQASSSSLTEDLWIRNDAPKIAGMISFVIDFFWVWFLGILLLASCLASVLSGMIIFRNEKVNIRYFALLGLSNLLTIIGLIIASSKLDKKYLKSKKLSEKVKKNALIIGTLVVFLTVLGFAVTSSFYPGFLSYCPQCGIAEILYRLMSVMVIVFLIMIVFGGFPLFFVGIFLFTFDKNRKTKEFVILFSAIFMGIVLGFWAIFAALIG